MITTCPECGKSLKLKSQVSSGKRIKCPKCAAVFAPVEEEEEEEAAPVEEISERPQRKRRREREDDDDEPDVDDDDRERRRRRKRAKARSGGSPALLWGLLGGGALLVIAVVVVLLVVLSGGSGARAQHEEAMKEALQVMADLENAMNSVKDPDSARVAAVKVNQICDRLEALGNKVRAFPKLTASESKQLQDKYKPQADAFNQRMQKVGFQAGLNSRGEASFVAAAQRLVRVGQALQQLGI